MKANTVEKILFVQSCGRSLNDLNMMTEGSAALCSAAKCEFIYAQQATM